MTEAVNPLSDIQNEFKAFREECQWCKVVFNMHHDLFESGEKNSALLRKSAVWFFDDISGILQEYHIMVVGRLTDPKETSGKKNLTVEHLVSELRRLNLCSTEIEDCAENVQNYRKLINKSRNKLVAHRDRDTILENIRGDGHLLEDVNKFHSDLNLLCDLIANAIEIDPMDFSATPAKGDAIDLIRLLRKFEKIQEIVG